MSARQEGREEPTRDRILRAAVEIFAEKGYHGAGMTELGDAADIRRGALYYHIGSKEELLFDLCKRHVEVALERGRQAVARSDEAREQFVALVREHVHTLADRRADVVVAEREMHALTGDRAVQLAKLRREYQDLFTSVLELGVSQGQFSRAEPLDVMGVLGLLNYTYMWLDPQGPVPLDDVADRLSGLLMDGLDVR